MSETNNKFSSVFSNKFITRTYCSILKKAFKKNQYYNLHYVENFEFRDGITFTGYLRKDVPLFGEFRKDNKMFFGFLTNPKRKKPFREFGLFSCSDGYYEFGTFKDEKIIYNPEYPFFGLVTKDGKTTLKEYPLDEMPAIDFYNYKTNPDFLRYILPKDLIRIRFLKNEYGGFYYGETKEDNTPCGYGVYFFKNVDNYLFVACGCFDGWYHSNIKVVTDKPYFVNFVNCSYSHLKFGYGNIEVVLSENTYGPQITLKKCDDGQSRELELDDDIRLLGHRNLFTMIFHDKMVNIKKTELSAQDYNQKRPFDFDYRIPVFRTNLAILSEIVTGNCTFIKKVIENVDFSHTGMSKAEYLNIITSGNGSAEYARQKEYYDRKNAEYERKEAEERRLEAERKAEQERLEQEERQRKLRELKEKERKGNEELSRMLGADMEKIKVYLNAVFRHAVAERETYQGYKCKIELVSEEYKVENGKLLVTFKVNVVVLESVGRFTYGSSWVDKQGRFHGSTTADDARRSARRAVELVQQHAISEFEKELNWSYGHIKISYGGIVIVPLPKDRVSMRVELMNAGKGTYDISSG